MKECKTCIIPSAPKLAPSYTILASYLNVTSSCRRDIFAFCKTRAAPSLNLNLSL